MMAELGPQEHVVDLESGMAHDQDIDDATRAVLAEAARRTQREQDHKVRRELALTRLRYEAFSDQTLADLLLVLGLE